MIQHKIAKLAGKAQKDGRLLYGYIAVCGAKIVSLSEMSTGQAAAVGPLPHAHCAKCYKEEIAEGSDIRLPEGDLNGDVYDEKGNKLTAVRDQEDKILRSAREREDLGVPGKDVLGAYENRPYG
jgi:hypothetical protein